MGQAGRSWPEIAATLNAWNFRTARNKRWTALNARQYWHTIATVPMRLDRSRALERDRGIETSYMKRMRKDARTCGLDI